MIPKLNGLVLCGPSGVGKTTIIRRLISENPNLFTLAVFHTTRKPRIDEINGREYFFTTRDEVERKLKNNEFFDILNCEYSGNFYGITKKNFSKIMKGDRLLILDLDLPNIIKLKNTNLKFAYFFIKPVSIEALKEQLIGRGSETEESLIKRLEIAETQLNFQKNDTWVFDHVIVNENLKQAYENFRDCLSLHVPALDYVR